MSGVNCVVLRMITQPSGRAPRGSQNPRSSSPDSVTQLGTERPTIRYSLTRARCQLRRLVLVPVGGSTRQEGAAALVLDPALSGAPAGDCELAGVPRSARDAGGRPGPVSKRSSYGHARRISCSALSLSFPHPFFSLDDDYVRGRWDSICPYHSAHSSSLGRAGEQRWQPGRADHSPSAPGLVRLKGLPVRTCRAVARKMSR
jgi:hypothetical protein